MSWLLISDNQNPGASASASVLPMSIQGWFPLRLTDLIFLLSKGLSGVFSNTTVWRHLFFGALPSLWSSSHIRTWCSQSSSVRSLSRVQLFVTPRIAARQASLSVTNSRSRHWQKTWLCVFFSLWGNVAYSVCPLLDIWVFLFLYWEIKYFIFLLLGEEHGASTPAHLRSGPWLLV